MKKFIAIATVLIITLILSLPMLANAASSVNIAITAQGSEISITCSEDNWAIGTVSASETAQTAINFARVTNDGGAEAVDVSIHGHDATGGAVTWTLADDATPGDAIIGMSAGQDDADDLFDIVIKKNTTYNWLAEEIATDAHVDFGLKFWAPTVNVGNEAMTMGSSGLTLTGSID